MGRLTGRIGLELPPNVWAALPLSFGFGFLEGDGPNTNRTHRVQSAGLGPRPGDRGQDDKRIFRVDRQRAERIDPQLDPSSNLTFPLAGLTQPDGDGDKVATSASSCPEKDHLMQTDPPTAGTLESRR